MVITNRQELILEKLIDEYIETACPVSSQSLEKKYDFGIGSAMIRIELERLADDGFLLQPFVSAGRVPTDASYRFYVDKILAGKVPEYRGIEKIEQTIEDEKEDTLKLAAELADLLARSSSSIAMLHLSEEDLFFKEGWEEVMRQPEFADRDLLFCFGDFLKDLEEKISGWDINSEMKIFIGKENPNKKGENFATISAACHLPGKKKGVVSLVGPKRMPYEKNISLVHSLLEIMDNF